MVLESNLPNAAIVQVMGYVIFECIAMLRAHLTRPCSVSLSLLCIVWRLDPPKMVSGKGFGTNQKNR